MSHSNLPSQIVVIVDGEPVWIVPFTGSVVGSTDGASTTSASFVPIPEMSLPISSHGLPLWCQFDGVFDVRSAPGESDVVEVALFIDGVKMPGTERAASLIVTGVMATSYEALMSTGIVYNLSPGNHVLEARYRRPSGTGASRVYGTQRHLTAREHS